MTNIQNSVRLTNFVNFTHLKCYMLCNVREPFNLCHHGIKLHHSALCICTDGWNISFLGTQATFRHCRTISSKASFLSWSVTLTSKSGLSEAIASLVIRAMRLEGSSGVWLDHNGIPAWAHAYPSHWNACDLLHALHIALRVLWKVFPSPYLPQLATSALKPYQLPGFGVDSWQVKEPCISVGREV